MPWVRISCNYGQLTPYNLIGTVFALRRLFLFAIHFNQSCIVDIVAKSIINSFQICLMTV